MRRVTLGATGIETSCLGFGCAALGSRVDAAEGGRALGEAFAGGVTWFDLAPVYGAGQAEAIAAPFLRAHRDEVQIATKVGLALGRGYAGGGAGGLRAALMPLARRAIGSIGPLRRALRRTGVTANARLPLTPELITGSLEASLARLGTDRVELFALHAATPEEVGREEILRALEGVLAAGKARAVAVASGAGAAAAALAQGAPYGVIQYPQVPPGTPDELAGRAAAAGFGRITHSVFGVGGTWDALRRRLAADPAAAARLAGAGGDAEAALAEALLGHALAANPDGVVLVSMVSARSRARNLAAAASPPGAGAAALAGLLAGA